MTIFKGDIAAPIPSVMSPRNASLPAVEAAHASTPPSWKSSGRLKLSDLVLPMMAYSVDENDSPGPDPADGELYTVFELGCVTLKDYLKTAYAHSSLQGFTNKNCGPAFSRAQLGQLVVSLLEMTYAVHSKGLVHLDLKPGNVMLTKRNELKIIDFDGALKADSVLNPDDSQLAFTPAYCSPELAKGIVAFMSNMRLGGGRPPQVVASRKMDIWSLGVTICEVFSGICPTAEVLASFAGSHNRLLAYFHWLNDFSKPLNFHAAVMRRFDADLADLVRRMLAKDSEKRISSTQCLMSDYYIKQKRAIENARVETELISWRGDKVFSTRPVRRSTQRASFSGVWCGLKPKWPRVWPFSREKLAKVRPDTAGMIIVA